MALPTTKPQDQGPVSASEPRSAYLWPEVVPGTPPDLYDAFVFQYWPSTLSDSESPSYAEKVIPGGSHPLLQWTGGAGRTISFSAIFTAEIDVTPTTDIKALNPSLFNALGGAKFTPSDRYTVNINAAIAKLKSYQRGLYPDGALNASVKPPKRLYLVLEGTNLGGDHPEILTVMRTGDVTYQAWFPSGNPRIAEVSLSFTETVQHVGDTADASQITFIGRSSFEKAGKNYTYRGTVDKVNS